MLRSQMINHIKANLGNRTNLDSTLSIDWLNWSIKDLVRMYNWKCLHEVDNSIKTVEGQYSYGYNTQIKDIMYCRFLNDSSSKSLTYLPPSTFAKMFAHAESDGQNDPDYYTIEGDFIKFYPIPSESGLTIEIFCVKYPDELDNIIDAECPLSGLEPAVIAMATVYGCHSLGDWEKVAYYDSMAKKLIRRYSNSENDPTDYKPQWGTRVPVSYGQQTTEQFVVPPV